MSISCSVIQSRLGATCVISCRAMYTESSSGTGQAARMRREVVDRKLQELGRPLQLDRRMSPIAGREQRRLVVVAKQMLVVEVGSDRHRGCEQLLRQHDLRAECGP